MKDCDMRSVYLTAHSKIFQARERRIPMMLCIVLLVGTGSASTQTATAPATPKGANQPPDQDNLIKQINALRRTGRFDEAVAPIAKHP